MVGGLFGVSTIDMGMCSSFTAVRHQKEEKHSLSSFYGKAVVKFTCLFFFFFCCSFSPCPFTFPFLFCFLFLVCALHGLFSRVKSASHEHMCFGNV
jgi:hypothetical protein